MRWLAVNPGTPEERRVALVRPMVVGRGEDCEISMGGIGLSRHHARITLRDGRAWLEDLGSKNGSLVNGLRVGETELRPGDLVQLGELTLRLLEPTDPSGPSPSIVRNVARVRSYDPVTASSATDLAGRFRTLLDVARLFAQPIPIDALLERIVELARPVIGADRATLLVADPATGALSPVVARPDPDDAAFSRTIAEWVLAHDVAALFVDARQDPRAADAWSVQAYGIRACMAAPVRTGDRVLGVLYVDARAPDRFDEADVDFLGAFANQAAIAIENAGLRRQLEAEGIARATLQRFFPPATREEILATRGEIPVVETEITAVFCDVSDYTALAARMAPREVIGMLNRYFPVVSGAAFAHGGTLEKYIGDALLAVWGAPIRRPDDADRALQAAIAMRAAVSRLNAAPDRDHPELHVHIGIHTGPAAAGNIGSSEYLQYATIGDGPNIAARVCGWAEAGEIALTDSTWRRLSAPPLDAVRTEGVALKGQAEAFTLWKLGKRGALP